MAALVVAAVVGPAAPAPAAGAAGACSSLVFVGLRGSGQTRADAGGYGKEVRQVRDAVAATADRSTFREVAVDYTAASVDLLVPWKTAAVPAPGPIGSALAAAAYQRNVQRYLASITDGVVKGRKALAAPADGCPEPRFVLAGYSQGALVAHRLLNELAASGRAHQVAAAVLVADPARNARTAAHLRGSVPTPSSAAAHAGRGVTHAPPVSAFAAANRAADVAAALAPRVYTVCDRSDIVCDPNTGSLALSRNGVRVHTESYTRNGGVALLAREIATSLATGGPLPDAGSPSAPNQVPPAALGRWVGEAYQPSSGSTWTIDLTLRRGLVGAGAGTVRYPSLGCGGPLTLTGVSGTTAVVREVITPPHPRCVTVVVLRLQPTAAGLAYRALLPDGREVASTVLTRG